MVKIQGKRLLEVQAHIEKLATERSQLWQERYRPKSKQAQRVGTIETQLQNLYLEKRRLRAQWR